MNESQSSGVQVDAWRGCPAIENVAENRESTLGGMDPDLMRAASFGRGFECRSARTGFQHPKRRLRLFPGLRTGRLEYRSPTRLSVELTVNAVRFTSWSVTRTYAFLTWRSVNWAVSERLASGVLPKTITPEVSLSRRWMMARFAQRGSRCRSQS